MNKITVIVKEAFLDKYTGLTHKPGDKLTISRERYREILRRGNLVEPEKAAKETKNK